MKSVDLTNEIHVNKNFNSEILNFIINYSKDDKDSNYKIVLEDNKLKIYFYNINGVGEEALITIISDINNLFSQNKKYIFNHSNISKHKLHVHNNVIINDITLDDIFNESSNIFKSLKV